MKQFPSFRSCGVILALSAIPLSASNAGALRVNDEDPTVITSMTLSATTRVEVTLPTYCVSLAGPVVKGTPKSLDAQYKTFRFGPLDSGQQSAWPGVDTLSYSQQNGLTISGSSLNCYVTSPEGVRRPTPFLFSDTFEDPLYDARILSRVVQLPSPDNGFVYKYYVDTFIPPISATESVPIAITDGFDSAYFDGATSYWCQAGNQVLTTCATGATYNNVWIKATLPPGAAANNRYIVTRPLKAGVTSLPVSSAPITTAAVFLPPGFETRLDNNISSTYGSLSDERPEINTGSLGATLASWTEGGNAIGGSFTLSDDTNETAGTLLGAVVTATFNGVDTAVTVDCGSPTPITGNPRVGRTCTFSNLALPTVDFATDTAAGIYAPGISAELSIVAIDPRGQQTTVNLPIHVASADNDAPVFTVAPIAVPDGAKIPTLACSLVNKGSAQCGGSLADFITGIAPGPVGAVDELAAQTAALVFDANAGRGGNITCTADSGSPQLFGITGGPKLTASPDGKKASLSYVLNENQGAVTCTVQVRDAGTFYTGQSAATGSKTFRITVSP